MIEIKGLTKRFGALTAVDDLSLSINAGEIFGFIGPNGAGKSTTMKILACLLQPDAGEASVAGCDVRRDGDRIRRLLGYMPDFIGYYDDLTVDEYLQFFAAAFRISRKSRRATIDGVLELTDLTDKRDAMVASLSRGMSQRLGVARVLIHDPKVLLLDEPASGLDPRARIEMRELLAELARMGKTLMVSSHILSELAEMCSSIGIIEKGKLIYAGSIDEAYDRVKGGERVVIRLEATEDVDLVSSVVASKLAEDERVLSATPDADKPAIIRVELAPGQHGHHFLIERVIAAGGRIAAFEPKGVNLEDAFLRLTKGAVQ
ncbi:MAG: ABC transporter ATP-binding protein [Phycisphaerales bacterium]